MNDRILFYNKMETLEMAGVPVIEALSTVIDQVKDRKFKYALQAIFADIKNSEKLSAAMKKHPQQFSPVECSLIHVGETTGLLGEVYKNLGGWFEMMEKLNKMFLSKLAYPILLIHMAAFSLPVTDLVSTGSASGYGMKVLAFLLPFYLIAFLVFWIKKVQNKKSTLAKALDTLILYIPFLGRIVIKVDLLRFLNSLDITYSAGIPLGSALKLAINSCNNVSFRTRLLPVLAAVESGQHLGIGMQNSGAFPDMVIKMIDVGDKSGELHETLKKIHVYYEEDVEHSLKTLTKAVSFIIYFGVMATIAVSIIGFYTSYMSQTFGALGL